MRALTAADGTLQRTANATFAVTEWGSCRPLREDLVDLCLESAQAHARLIAASRRRDAWPVEDGRTVRLRRAPLVSVRHAGAYWLTTDVTEVGADETGVRWKSHFQLSEAEALAVLADNGFTGRIGAALLAAARRASPHKDER